MAAKNQLPFLDVKVPIVDEGGRPSPQFARWFQENIGQILKSIKDIEVAQGRADEAYGEATSTTGIAADVYGASTLIPVVTVDARGRITAIQEVEAAGGGANFNHDGGNASTVWVQQGVLRIDLGGAA